MNAFPQILEEEQLYMNIFPDNLPNQEALQKLEKELIQIQHTMLPTIDESSYMNRKYNIIDLITIKHIEDKNIVSKCALFNELICALLQYSYEQMSLKRNNINGSYNPIGQGWGYIYIVCEIIFNSNFFYTKFVDIFQSNKFIEYYNELDEHLFDKINVNDPPLDPKIFIIYILEIIKKFESKINEINNEIIGKGDFIGAITQDLPISFLFNNSIPHEFINSPQITVTMRLPGKNEIVVQHTMQDIESPPSQCHAGQCMLHTDMRYAMSVDSGGSNYKNNIITKLKVKKQATKRRQNKSRKHKSRKHKSRKHKSRKNKRLKKYT
jgi:hypothetical protein